MATELRRPERTFTIRQLCVEFKCTARALRFYEDKGLLAPARQAMNRVYSYKDRGRLQLILRGKRVGLSLAEIREILELYDKHDGGAAQNATALRKFRQRIAAFERQREDIDHNLAELREACARLEERLAQARPDLLAAVEPVAPRGQIPSRDRRRALALRVCLRASPPTIPRPARRAPPYP